MIRSLALVLSSALAIASLAACSTHEAKASPQTAKQAAATPEEAKALCVQMMTRARECTSDYIPALVDARARHDQPPGITDAVKKDRDAVIAEAMKEWEQDSKEESIAAMCEKMSPQMVNQEQAAIDHARDCVTQPACTEYTSCAMPIFEKHFAK